MSIRYTNSRCGTQELNERCDPESKRRCLPVAIDGSCYAFVANESLSCKIRSILNFADVEDVSLTLNITASGGIADQKLCIRD